MDQLFHSDFKFHIKAIETLQKVGISRQFSWIAFTNRTKIRTCRKYCPHFNKQLNKTKCRHLICPTTLKFCGKSFPWCTISWILTLCDQFLQLILHIWAYVLNDFYAKWPFKVQQSYFPLNYCCNKWLLYYVTNDHQCLASIATFCLI